MKPFTARLAMNATACPQRIPTSNGYRYDLHEERTMFSIGTSTEQRVIVIADTEENRRRIGMEES